MKLKSLIPLILVIIILVFPNTALADGIIIPEPPPDCRTQGCPYPPCLDCPVRPPMAQLDIRFHHVTVTIQDQVAVTHVDQVFFNPNDWQVEGTYVFPLPLDAAVSSFTLWMDGKPVEGKILDAEQARQTYEDIVRTMRDPALLEYAGRGAVQAHIFPIPPQGERRIELEYSQVLPIENGLVRYVYPLNTEKFSAQPLGSVSLSVEISSSTPIRAVYSPTHEVSISRQGDNQVKAGYEASNVLPTEDFALYYSVGETEAFHLMTFRDPSDPTDPDGAFLLLLAPRPDAAIETQPKDVILVLDRSGSMDGEKFQQAQEALRYILSHLNPEDRFNLIAFSTGLETYASSLRPAGEVKEAAAWVDGLSAGGSTDINRALLEAAALVGPGTEGERPTYLIFLTDGLPTEGVTDRQAILDNFAAAAPASLRLFAFGVGYDVDTSLLDSLAQSQHGASAYVQPGERLDERLSAFYAKISTPVMTGLTLDFGGMHVYDLLPAALPDLFAGSQIVLTGRYKNGGTADITLTGTVNGKQQVFRFRDQVFDQRSAIGDQGSGEGLNNQKSAILRLWATRKIGYLLSQVRLKGSDQETIDQIVRLSIRYGIVTPYTSYLVTEQMPLGAAEQERIAGEQFNQYQQMPAAPASGADAVQKAIDQGALSAAQAPAVQQPEAANRVKLVGSRAFVLSNETWIDTAFDPDTMKTVKVPFLSKDYFVLTDARPDLAAAFALGQKVIALSDGVAYEVVDSNSPAAPVKIPPTYTPLPAKTAGPAIATPVAHSPDNVVQPAEPAPKEGIPWLAGLLPVGVLLVVLGVVFMKRSR